MFDGDDWYWFRCDGTGVDVHGSLFYVKMQVFEEKIVDNNQYSTSLFLKTGHSNSCLHDLYAILTQSFISRLPHTVVVLQGSNQYKQTETQSPKG
jgi:hypothetical protein